MLFRKHIWNTFASKMGWNDPSQQKKQSETCLRAAIVCGPENENPAWFSPGGVH